MTPQVVVCYAPAFTEVLLMIAGNVIGAGSAMLLAYLIIRERHDQ